MTVFPATGVVVHGAMKELRVYSFSDVQPGHPLEVRDTFFQCKGCIDVLFQGFPETMVFNKSEASQLTALQQAIPTEKVEVFNPPSWKRRICRVVQVVASVLFGLSLIIFAIVLRSFDEITLMAFLGVLFSLLLYWGGTTLLGAYNEVLVDHAGTEPVILKVDGAEYPLLSASRCVIFMDAGVRKIEVVRKNDGALLDSFYIDIPKPYASITTCTMLDQAVLNVGCANSYSLHVASYHSY